MVTSPSVSMSSTSARNASTLSGHAFVQDVRRGHYELAVEEPANRRVAVAFDELASAI
jgi:IS6 family transposase